MLSKLFLLTILGVVLLPLSTASAYCHNSIQEPVKFCMDVRIFKNETTSGDDYYFTLATAFGEQKGWLAIGSGTHMEDALMFVIYPTIENEGLFLTTRTTIKHYPPHILQYATPIVEVQETKVENLTNIMKWTCYGCNMWSGSKFDSSAESQPFIFARNYEQIATSRNSPKVLQQHDVYGVLFFDLLHANGDLKEQPASPSIDLTSLDVEIADISDSTHKMTAHQAHGIIMCLAFGAILPFGVLAIRWKPLASFTKHWVIQLLFTVTEFLGAFIGWRKSIANGGIRNLNDPHKIFGMVITAVLSFQIFLGYLHHRQYLAKMRETYSLAPLKLGKYHKYFGRCVFVGGAINVCIGFRKGHHSNSRIVVWICFILLQIVLFRYLVIPKAENENDEVNPPGGSPYQNCSINESFTIGDSEDEK